MSAVHGVQSTFGLTTPTGAYVAESRRSVKIGKAIVRDEDGEIVRMRGKKLKETDVTISGKGDPNFAGVTVGDFTADAVKVVSAEGTEMQDGEYPDFTIEGKAFGTVA